MRRLGQCLCGDLLCTSCGPRQGNTRCYVCGRWASEGGCEDAEACSRLAIKDAESEVTYYEELNHFLEGL